MEGDGEEVPEGTGGGGDKTPGEEQPDGTYLFRHPSGSYIRLGHDIEVFAMGALKLYYNGGQE